MTDSSLQILIRDSENYYVKGNRSHYAIWKISFHYFFDYIKKYQIDIINQSGIYILVNENNSICYIGETDRLERRMKEHFSDKDWISNIFLIFSEDKTNKLDKDSSKYIENKIIHNLKDNLDIEIKNKQNEYNKNLGYTKESTLDNEWDIIFFYLKFLEPKMFDPDNKKGIIKKVDNNENTIEVFIDLKDNKKIKGIFNLKDYSITILKNQKFNIKFKKYFMKKNSINNIMKKYKNYINWEFINGESYNIFIKENWFFKTPSSAASFIKGCNMNGWTTWKDKNHKFINEYRDIQK